MVSYAVILLPFLDLTGNQARARRSGGGGRSGRSGLPQGTEVIRDLISSRDLLIVGTIESGQSRLGFDRERFIQLTQGSSESLQLRSTAYDPAIRRGGATVRTRAGLSVTTRVLCVFGLLPGPEWIQQLPPPSRWDRTSAAQSVR